MRAEDAKEAVERSCCTCWGEAEFSSAARKRASPARDCSTCSWSALSTILRIEKSSTAVQTVSTSTKESSSLEKTLPVIRSPVTIAAPVENGSLSSQRYRSPGGMHARFVGGMACGPAADAVAASGASGGLWDFEAVAGATYGF